MEVSIKRLPENALKEWDDNIQQFEMVHPYHAFGWGQVKKDSGLRPVYLVAQQNDSVRGAIMLIFKKLPGVGRTIGYSPRGPLWHIGDNGTLASLLDAAIEVSTEFRAIFLRIESNIEAERETELPELLKSNGFKKVEQRWSIWNAPCDELRVDLRPYDSDDHYFKSLKKRTRNSIRKADKEGITIERGESLEDLKRFYEIYQEFSSNKGFLIRGFSHQESLWQHYINRGMGRLFLAKYNGEIIGGGTSIIYGKKYLGVHIGVLNEFRKLHTSYALTYKDIQCAKKLGCDWFSFGGASSESQEYFKMKFLSEKIPLLQYFDLPIDSVLYKMTHLFEFSVMPKGVPLVKNVFNKIGISI